MISSGKPWKIGLVFRAKVKCSVLLGKSSVGIGVEKLLLPRKRSQKLQ